MTTLKKIRILIVFYIVALVVAGVTAFPVECDPKLLCSIFSIDQETINQMSVKVSNPQLWSAEKPYLYTVILDLKDKNGKTLEAMTTQFGFRNIEIKNKDIYVYIPDNINFI